MDKVMELGGQLYRVVSADKLYDEIDECIEDVKNRLRLGKEEYGNFNEEVARIVKAYKILRRHNEEFTIDDYVVLMLLTKIYRNYTKEKLDNVLDIAGYSVLWYRLIKNRYD